MSLWWVAARLAGAYITWQGSLGAGRRPRGLDHPPDLKPDNIMLVAIQFPQAGDAAKLSIFGSARLASATLWAATHSRKQHPWHAHLHVAVEHCRGCVAFGPRVTHNSWGDA